MQAKSSYDFQFAKPQLKWLFRDYNRANARSLLYFSPPEDPRVSITARLGASIEQPGKDSQGTAIWISTWTYSSAAARGPSLSQSNAHGAWAKCAADGYHAVLLYGLL